MYLSPQDYLFHRSPMLLIEHIETITPESVTCSISLNSPLLAPFLEPKGLPSYFGIELMAQTVGIWSGYQDKCAGREAAKGGLILSVRAFEAQQDYITCPHDVPLIITMNMLMQDRNYASFEGTISQSKSTTNDGILATGRLSLCQLDAELEQRLGFSA